MFADRLNDYVTDLARHYERSGNLHKTIEYLGRAGRRAAEQAAHAEAVGCVTRALELLQRLPDEDERVRQELELQITLGRSLLVTAGPGSREREKALARALDLCERLGDNRMMEVMLSLAIVHWSRREPLQSLQLSEKVLALAEHRQDADGCAAAHAAIAHQLLSLGEFERSLEHFEVASELARGGPSGKFGQFMVTAQSAPVALGLPLLFLGFPTTALKKSKEALDIRHRLSEPYLSTFPRAIYIQMNMALRNLGGVTREVEELAAICAEHGIGLYDGLARCHRALLNMDAGRVKERLAEIRQIITQLAGVPPVDHVVVEMAEACRRNGLPDEGLATIEDGFARSEKTPHLHAEFFRLKGELTLLKDSGSKEEAEQYLRQAIGVARRQAARLFELRATTSLAALLRDTNRREQARAMLAEVYSWFTEGFDTADLKDAKALLDELKS